MKTKTTIAELTHDDLVNLFSTALYGSNYLSADWDDDLPTDENACYEDVLADILLAGGKVYFKDHYAEGEKFRDWAEFDTRGNAVYPVRLHDVMVGLENACNGTFHVSDLPCSSDWKEKNLAFARRSFEAFLNESSNWDYATADCLMQIILFNGIIYG